MQTLGFIFESVISIASWLVGTVIILMVIFIVIAVLFGKKVEKQYDLEAEFNDEDDKEFADFDLSSWRYEKEGGEFQFEASFKWRDSRLALGSQVEVCLENQVVLQGTAEESGKINLHSKQHLANEPKSPQAGQTCQIKLNGEVVLEQPLHED